ncbi:MAG: hypothetical protein JNK11_18380 [Alphaproteobacteria bacterium]|nr:hypothetical protein [Alphaproteobacteria bacterium]
MTAACGDRMPLESPDAQADRIAARGKLQPWDVATPTFPLKGYRRAARAGSGAALRVYIESDGQNFVRGRLSGDPTPALPISLQLAAADDWAGPVIFLARPCQYGLRGAPGFPCEPRVWDQRRYGRDAVAAANAAVDQAKAWSGAPSVELIGYSGGGVIAALVAAGRPDVARLVTIASPLDSTAWTRDTNVDSIDDSINPADIAAQLIAVPQAHAHGASDRVVRPTVAASYRNALVRASSDGKGPWTFLLEPGADHDCCWLERWPDLRRRLGLK